MFILQAVACKTLYSLSGMKNIVLIIIILGLFSLCKNKNHDSTPDNPDINGKKWALQYIQNTGSQAITHYPDTNRKITIEFSGNKNLIFDGVCNTGGGNYTLSNQNITIHSLTVTEIYCTNIDWETLAVNGLREAYQFRVSGLKLTIFSNAGYNLVFE